MFCSVLLKVADGEVTDFDQCLCTLEFLNKMKPLQKILREKMPTTRRGMETSHKNACADVNVLLGNYVYNAKLISLESF